MGDGQKGAINGYPIIWSSGLPTELSTPLPGQIGAAAAINNAGEVAGWTGPGQPDVSATVWNNGVPSNLGPLPGGGEVTGLNDAGQVVGWDSTGPVTWNGGATIQLGSPPGERAVEATAINQYGQIVGWSISPSTEQSSATVWNDDVPTALGTLPGWTNSMANGINNGGQIVGTAESNSADQATLWSGGKIIDLGQPVRGSP